MNSLISVHSLSASITVMGSCLPTQGRDYLESGTHHFALLEEILKMMCWNQLDRLDGLCQCGTELWRPTYGIM